MAFCNEVNYEFFRILSGEVGSATCTKLVINMVFGTMIASLAEALSLGEKVGLQQEQILTILNLLPISSALTTTKGTGNPSELGTFPFLTPLGLRVRHPIGDVSVIYLNSKASLKI